MLSKGCAQSNGPTKAQALLAEQCSLLELLLDTHPQAVMVWQDSRVLQANSAFDHLIGAPHATDRSRSLHWQRWMSPLSLRVFETAQVRGTLETTLTSVANTRHKARLQSLMLPSGPARLLQLDVAAIADTNPRATELDSVTGLPSRRAFTDKLQHWLGTLQTDTHILSLRVQLPQMYSESGAPSIDGTLQDLLAYRASTVLEQQTGQNILLGRCDQRSLILVQLSLRHNARSVATAIKASLGSLGGLIDDGAPIKIKTLTCKASTYGAHELLWHLEADASPTPAKIDKPVPTIRTLTTKVSKANQRRAVTLKPRLEVVRFAHPEGDA